MELQYCRLFLVSLYHQWTCKNPCVYCSVNRCCMRLLFYKYKLRAQEEYFSGIKTEELMLTTNTNSYDTCGMHLATLPASWDPECVSEELELLQQVKAQTTNPLDKGSYYWCSTNQEHNNKDLLFQILFPNILTAEPQKNPESDRVWENCT